MEDKPWAKGEGVLPAIPRQKGSRGELRVSGRACNTDWHGRTNDLGNGEANGERGSAGARASVHMAA